MAKTGLLETDPTAVARKETELKEELQRLVKLIVDEDDCSAHTSDQALKTLYALKDLKSKLSVSFGLKNLAFPEEFRCPISKQIMRDPVVLSTGRTFDRPFIQKWLKEGNRTCPKTQQVLSHLVLTPNHLVRELISIWCKEQGIELPKPFETTDDDVITDADRGRLSSLLEKMSSSSLPDQKEAAKELRLLTKRLPFFRALFGESTDGITQLLHPLSQGSTDIDPELQEDVITTVLNVSIHENNKKQIAENAAVIALLIESLSSGTIDKRRNAAAALFSLSDLDSNKSIIGESGAIKPLLDLIEGGNPLAMRDSASATFSLCIHLENKGRAVREGAVTIILKKIMEGMLVDELVAILAMLSSHQRALDEMIIMDAVPTLLRIIRESTCERTKENCISILHTIFFARPTKMIEITEDEDVHGTISKLAETGTLRAKRKAKGILEIAGKPEA